MSKKDIMKGTSPTIGETKTAGLAVPPVSGTKPPPGSGVGRRVVKSALSVCFTLCGMLWAFSTSSQTVVSSLISADTHWTVGDGPYQVNGDVVIKNGARLIIDPGVTIYMASNTSLTVQAGGIQALGSADHPIRVLSDKSRLGQSPAPGDWKRWVFSPGTVDTRLEHVAFAHGSGLVVNGSAPIFNFVDIRNQQGAAITGDLAASPSGAGNTADGNTVNGIVVPAGEILGSVKWELQGIPYVVGPGVLSVGAPPSLNSITPNTLQQGDSITVTLTGNRLIGLGNIHFAASGLSAQVVPGTTTDTQSQLSVTADATTTLGPTSISAQTDAGGIHLPDAMTVKEPEPQLASVSPNFVYTKQPEQALAIAGKNILPTSVAELDGMALSTQYVSETTIQATIPTQSAAGTRSLRLRTPNPADASATMLSNALTFTVSNPPPVTLKGATEYGPPATAVTEFTINQPKETALGDYLLLVVYRRVPITVPAGYTFLAEVANNGGWQWASVYGKMADVGGDLAQTIRLASSSPRVGASMLALRAGGMTPVLYGPWKKLVPGQSSAHTVPAANSPAEGLAVAVNHEGYAWTGAATNLYANSPYIPARVRTALDNRFAVATRSVSAGIALGGSVTADLNTDGGDMVFVMGW